MSVSAEQAAMELMDVVPLVSRVIRAEMRQHRGPDLSVPQFRTLAFVGRRPGTSLSDVAAHIGLTLPSMSRLVDGLVKRELLLRLQHHADRRRITLTLTAHGQATLASTRQVVQEQLAQTLETLSPEQREIVVQGMLTLRPLFTCECKSDNLTEG